MGHCRGLLYIFCPFFHLFYDFIWFLVENEQHCDFVKLREALIRTNVDSLRERTHNVGVP